MYLASLLGQRVNKQFRDANKLPFATKQRAALQAPHDRPDGECFGSESDPGLIWKLGQPLDDDWLTEPTEPIEAVASVTRANI